MVEINVNQTKKCASQLDEMSPRISRCSAQVRQIETKLRRSSEAMDIAASKMLEEAEALLIQARSASQMGQVLYECSYRYYETEERAASFIPPVIPGGIIAVAQLAEVKRWLQELCEIRLR